MDVIEDTSDNLLYALFTSSVQEGTVIHRCWSLIVFTVQDEIGRVGTVL